MKPRVLLWVLLLAASGWFSWPLLTGRAIGTGDALWNALHMADAIDQFRHGIFPVYVGQGRYQFNGSIYPFRVAPYYLYLGGALDLMTGRALSAIWLEHLAAAVSLGLGLLTTWLSLLCLAPRRPGATLALAVLYVGCPGVLGLVYSQDLYMSTMAIPWCASAFAGVYGSYQRPSRAAYLLAGVSLALLWWAHSPIALWTSLLGAFLLLPQLPSLAKRWRLWLPGLCACAGLSAYVFLSAALVRAPGEHVVPYAIDRSLLLKELSDAFPAVILPLNRANPTLTYLQVGYALLALPLLAIGAALRVRACRIEHGLGLAACAALALLLYPVPGITAFAWRHLPETLVSLTLLWPMQRLCILFAGIAVACAASVLDRLPDARSTRLALEVFLGCALAWTLFQSREIMDRCTTGALSLKDSQIAMRPENAALQRHSYHLFASFPSTFSQGFMDPTMESRLLRPDGSWLATNADAAPPARTPFGGEPDANPGILNLTPELTLEPGAYYLLRFRFAQPDLPGVLQVVGPHTFRQYTLPDSGYPRAFGARKDEPKVIGLWTTAKSAETVRLRFIPTDGRHTAVDAMPFGSFSFTAVRGEALPVRTEGLLPAYLARVRSPQPAILETPRLLIPGYEATVNGTPRPVLKTADGFVGVAVPRGESEVLVRFRPPFLLAAGFWLSAFCGIGLLLWAAVRLGRRALGRH